LILLHRAFPAVERWGYFWGYRPVTKCDIHTVDPKKTAASGSFAETEKPMMGDAKASVVIWTYGVGVL
jgi:hypothetical protein